MQFYPGVEEWFDGINHIGDDLGVKVEHYIISSGLYEIIEGSKIFKAFEKVFACEFLYDKDDFACWPKNVVNYTTKTQFLFRINKGILDISNDADINKYTPEHDRAVPFRNMIYIGDGLTDVPCMRLVRANGGYSVAVYQNDKMDMVKELLLHKRVDFIELVDFSGGSLLYKTVTNIISTIAMVDSLKNYTKNQIDLLPKEETNRK